MKKDNNNTESLLLFLKDWMLVIGIITGITSYLVYAQIPALHRYGHFLESAIHFVQPVLLFLMLFISFCRIDPKQLVVRPWQIRNLSVQVVCFLLLSGTVMLGIHGQSDAARWIVRNRLLFETGMLCMICPTATSCAVVAGRLGGDMAQVVMYTIMINLTVAILVPLTVPLLYPDADVSFLASFSRILSKVFPLLILPCLAAWTVRAFLPGFHNWVSQHTNTAFYLWSIALTLAVTIGTRAIANSNCSILLLLGMALVSLLCCIFQFSVGGRIGQRYNCRVEGSQTLGQKNTVFGIWMGYTFWDPLLSVSGAMYTIWHNLRNTMQLYRHSHSSRTGSR